VKFVKATNDHRSVIFETRYVKIIIIIIIIIIIKKSYIPQKMAIIKIQQKYNF